MGIGASGKSGVFAVVRVDLGYSFDSGHVIILRPVTAVNFAQGMMYSRSSVMCNLVRVSAM